MAKWLVCVAVLIAGCGPSYTPKKEAWPWKRVEASVLVQTGTASCWMDVYLADGSKVYVGQVDTRVCAMPAAAK
jgi:hypothetical protein